MDPRVDASSIRTVRHDHCDCIVPKTAKRSGATWVICRHLWCWLFLTNVLFAPHLKIISCCNTIAQANAKLLGIIEDQSAKFQHNYKWKTFFQRGPSYKFLAPSISLLLKDKSNEWGGVIQSRILVSHFHHSTVHYGNLVSRCVSVIGASISNIPMRLEI